MDPLARALTQGSSPDVIRMLTMGGGPTGRTRMPTDSLAGVLMRPILPPADDEGDDPTGYRWLWNNVLRPATSPLDLGLEAASGPMPAGAARRALGPAENFIEQLRKRYRQRNPDIRMRGEGKPVDFEAEVQELKPGRRSPDRGPRTASERIRAARKPRQPNVSPREVSEMARAGAVSWLQENQPELATVISRAEEALKAGGRMDEEAAKRLKSKVENAYRQAWLRAARAEGREGVLLRGADATEATGTFWRDRRRARDRQAATDRAQPVNQGEMDLQYSERPRPETIADLPPGRRPAAREHYQGEVLDVDAVEPFQGMSPGSNRDFRPTRQNMQLPGEHAAPLTAGDVAFPDIERAATREYGQQLAEHPFERRRLDELRENLRSGRLESGSAAGHREGIAELESRLPPLREASGELVPEAVVAALRSTIEDSALRRGRSFGELDPWTKAPTSAIGDLTMRPTERMGRFDQVRARIRRRQDPGLERQVDPIVEALMRNLMR